jgi:hypothetical protein
LVLSLEILIFIPPSASVTINLSPIGRCVSEMIFTLKAFTNHSAVTSGFLDLK